MLKIIPVYILTFICSLQLIFAQTSEENILSVKIFDGYGQVGYAEAWGWVGPDGHEYAIVNPKTGTTIVDLETDVPEDLGFIPGSHSVWHDVKTYKNYAYSVSDEGNQGIQIIDLSSLPGFVGLTKTWYGEGGANSISQVHNLYIDTVNARLFATGQGTQGVHFIDISDPLNPSTITKITGEAHDMCTNPDGTMLVQATGRSSSLAFWDISEIESPRFLVSISIGSGYSHQCWFHDDGIHMATTIETVGTKVKFWDVTPVIEGEEPILLDEWIADENVIGHNAHYEGDVVYIAHNTAGTWILDVRDHSDVKPLGHHDPSTSEATFAGTWGVYPWLPSGRVLHTDRSRGLMIVEPDPEIIPINGDWDPPQVSIKPDVNINTSFSISGYNGNDLVLRVTGGEYNGTIYNTRGKRVHSFPVSGEGPQVLNIQGSTLGPGNYFVELNNGTQSHRDKFVVSK